MLEIPIAFLPKIKSKLLIMAYQTFHHLTTRLPAHLAVGPLHVLSPAWNILSLHILICLSVSPDHIHLNLLYFSSFQ